jgi:very-short-patch-repair endonuclease
MHHRAAVAALSRLGAPSLGVFRGRDALKLGVSRKQISALHTAGVVERMHPDTYRMTSVPASNEQRLRAALLWAGDAAAAAGESAGEWYGLEGVRALTPEITVPRSLRKRAPNVLVRGCDQWPALMVREWRGLRVTGVEATLTALALKLDAEALEIACEDARRRRLTSIPALRAYLSRFDRPARPGAAGIRRLVDDLDPVWPSRSTLEVKTRRLLVANGFTDFVREFPLEWRGRTYRFDFAFPSRKTILETNGRRWHDDPADYESDNDKWSVPGRHGYRIVFAAWDKVTRRPADLLSELAAALAS